MILGKAAALFNSRGYFGASMSDVMTATGLEKGGIYNHFSSKDQLALEAFDFAFQTSSAEVVRHLQKHEKAIDKLEAYIDAFTCIASNPPVPGGCPLLNSAIESDDGHPEMKERVMKAMDTVLGSVENLIKKSILEGDIEPDTNAKVVARAFVATLEGGIMLAKLYSDVQYMDAIASSLRNQIKLLRIKR